MLSAHAEKMRSVCPEAAACSGVTVHVTDAAPLIPLIPVVDESVPAVTA